MKKITSCPLLLSFIKEKVKLFIIKNKYSFQAKNKIISSEKLLRNFAFQRRKRHFLPKPEKELC